MGNDRVLLILSELRDSVPDAVEVFTQGNCYRLFLLLRAIYPQAIAYYDQVEGHVYTSIDGSFYDIRGKHLPGKRWIVLGSERCIASKAHRWRYRVKRNSFWSYIIKLIRN